MTDYTEQELDLWGRVQVAARWCRDEAGALLATFWLIIVLFLIGGWIAYSFFQIDAEFSRPLAGGVMPPEVTQHLSWAILAFSIAGGPAIIWCHMNVMPKFQKLLIVLDVLAALLLILHAYGIASKVMEGQYHKAAAQTGVAEKAVTSVQDQIDDIDAAIARAVSDRDAALVVAQQTIDSTKDQVVGLSAADNETIQKANDDKGEALLAYRARVAELEAEKKALRTEEGTKLVEQVTADNDAESFNPLFTLMARAVTWTWDPKEVPADPVRFGCGVFFFTLFFGLGKLLMMTLFTIAYAMMLVARENARKNGRAQIIRLHAGQTAMVFDTDEEREEFERAKEVHDNIKAGAKKGARTKRVGTKIEQGREYAAERISDMMTLKQQGMATADIAKKFGLTLASMKASYMQYMTQEEIDFLFPTAVVPVSPGPQMTNGQDQSEGDEDDNSEPEQPSAH